MGMSMGMRGFNSGVQINSSCLTVTSQLRPAEDNGAMMVEQPGFQSGARRPIIITTYVGGLRGIQINYFRK